MRLRIYIDTSVIGGCMDKKFQTVSYQLIDKFKLGEMTVVISELTEPELKDAPQKVQNVLLEIPERFIVCLLENMKVDIMNWPNLGGSHLF